MRHADDPGNFKKPTLSKNEDKIELVYRSLRLVVRARTVVWRAAFLGAFHPTPGMAVVRIRQELIYRAVRHAIGRLRRTPIELHHDILLPLWS